LEALKPWTQLYEVIVLLSPLFVFSILSSLIIYLVFVIVLPFGAGLGQPHQGAPARPSNDPAKPILTERNDDDEFGYLGSFSYLVLASLFGLVLGMLVKLIGGFSALERGSPNTLIGAIGTVLVIVLGIVGGIFAESGRINLRKPVGAIAFLVSFLISGFYWKLLETAP
jgi:hypothetical protein